MDDLTQPSQGRVVPDEQDAGVILKQAMGGVFRPIRSIEEQGLISQPMGP